MTFKTSILFLISCIATIVFAISINSLHLSMEMWQFWTILISYVITIAGWTYIGKEVNKNEQ